MTTFCKNLKRLRLAKNLTQEQAAEALGVSAQSISRWECNTTLPDVTMLPKIAEVYCVSIDDLYKETSVAYDNYAQRQGAIYEASLKPEDFLRADQEYRKMMKSGEFTSEDLRLYGILHQHMMYYAAKKAIELFDRVLDQGPETAPDTYWMTQRQKIYLLYELGRNDESIAKFFALVNEGSEDIEEWICLISAFQFAQDNESAWMWIQKAQKKFPESAMLCCYAGHTCAAMGRLSEAFTYWDRTLELNPELTDAMYAKAECWEEQGQWQKAYEAWCALLDALEHRGFETELTYPRERARQCKEHIKR